MAAVTRKSFGRSRWVAAGATIAVLLGMGGVLTSSAAGPPAASSFVPITPCRLMDTRAGGPVGPRSRPIGAETYVAAVWGTNGRCTVPTTATAVSLNVTFANPTAGGFLSVFPADAAWPGTSNLNFSAGQAPAPNAVTSALSADGKLAIRNEAGTVDVLVDLVGYYVPASSGAAPTTTTPPTTAPPTTAPADACAAFVGTFVGSVTDTGVTTGMVVQLLAGGAMSFVPLDNSDPEAPTIEEVTAQEGRWTCSGTGFSARTLDMYRLVDSVNPPDAFLVGRWDWTGSLSGDTLTFTRSLCNFDLPLTKDVQAPACDSGAQAYPSATAARITVPAPIGASAVPESPSGGEGTHRRP